jgi:hypothetical protein
LLLLAASAYRTLENAKADILTAEAGASAISHHPNLLTSRSGRAQLATTLSSMKRAADRANRAVADSFSLSLLSGLPLIGNELRGATTLITDAKTLTDQGTLLLDKVRAVTAESQATHISLPDLQALSDQVEQSKVALASLDRSDSGLWGPIRTARHKFNHDIGYVNGVLGKGGEALRYALPLLGQEGSKRYFLGLQNSAEMRDQGAVLSWAMLNTQDGNYSVDDPQSVATLRLENPVPFVLPAGTQEVFGPLEPTRIWPSTNASADFPLSGAIMSAMYTKATRGDHVDGVVGMDVVALAELLRLTGPIKVDGYPTNITANNVAALVLNRLYLKYPAGDEQAARRDDLATIASATVSALKTSDVDVARLTKSLAKCVAGRHLMIWDQDPAHQAIVADFQASGSISGVNPTRTFHLAVESAVAAKMDFYIHTSVAYQVRVLKSGQAFVQTTLTVRNTAPPNARPSYAVGPDRINSTKPGQYVSRTYLWSPLGSVVAGGIEESGLVVNPTTFTVDAGATEIVTFQTILPDAVRDGKLNLHFIPQGLLHHQPTTLSVVGDGVTLQGKTSVKWSADHQVDYSVGVKS